MGVLLFIIGGLFMRSIRIVLIGLLFSALFVTGCSSKITHKQNSATHNSPTEKIVSVSLAHNYGTYEQLVSASDLVGEVKILNVNSVDKEKGITNYNAKVFDIYKDKNGKKPKNIIVKQLGIQNGNEKVIVEGTPLFKPNNKAILFLKHAYENVYYIVGEYQGNFDIENGKVYSRDTHVDRKSYSNGIALTDFKNKILDIVKNQ
jgi:hypothetical protein